MFTICCLEWPGSDPAENWELSDSVEEALEKMWFTHLGSGLQEFMEEALVDADGDQYPADTFGVGFSARVPSIRLLL